MKKLEKMKQTEEEKNLIIRKYYDYTSTSKAKKGKSGKFYEK
jgi:hypothetical protein